MPEKKTAPAADGEKAAENLPNRRSPQLLFRFKFYS
jgi:hypothetical protein